MSTPYTKGPWIEDGNGFAPTWDVSSREGSICTVATNRSDARLIACAPELIEACAYAFNQISANTGRAEVLKVLKQVLDKAIGGVK